VTTPTSEQARLLVLRYHAHILSDPKVEEWLNENGRSFNDFLQRAADQGDVVARMLLAPLPCHVCGAPDRKATDAVCVQDDGQRRACLEAQDGEE
jgi:hypothetical protein